MEGNRRLRRRRCASLETCGGPEGGTRELLTGSFPGLCGAYGFQILAPLLRTRDTVPGSLPRRRSPEEPGRGRTWERPVSPRRPTVDPSLSTKRPWSNRRGTSTRLSTAGLPRGVCVCVWGGSLRYQVFKTKNILGKNLLSRYRRERTSGEKAFELASPRHQNTGAGRQDAFAAWTGI